MSQKIELDDLVTVTLTGQQVAYVLQLVDARQKRLDEGVASGRVRPDQQPPGGGLSPLVERALSTAVFERFDEGMDRVFAARGGRA